MYSLLSGSENVKYVFAISSQLLQELQHDEEHDSSSESDSVDDSTVGRPTVEHRVEEPSEVEDDESEVHEDDESLSLPSLELELESTKSGQLQLSESFSHTK